MEENPTRICELLVGLGDVEVLGVATTRPVRLIWHKHRWCCVAASCEVGSFTEADERIAPARSALTARAGRWATMGCDWHTANRAVLAWGEALLAADTARVGSVSAPGARHCPWSRRRGSHPVAGGSTPVVAPEHRLGGAGPLRRVPARLRRGAAPRRPGRRPVPRHPPRQQQHRRSAPAHPATRSAPAAAKTTPCIGRGDCSSPPTNASANAATPNSAACSPPATPTAKSAWRGTPKKPSAASTTSTAPTSPSATPPNSPTTSKTPTARPNCAAWAAPWPAGTPKSSTGTTPASPTDGQFKLFRGPVQRCGCSNTQVIGVIERADRNLCFPVSQSTMEECGVVGGDYRVVVLVPRGR